jgi:hypothetical protein
MIEGIKMRKRRQASTTAVSTGERFQPARFNIEP